MYSVAVYYDLTTINPMAVNMAVPRGIREIRLPDYSPIELYTIHQRFELGKIQINKDNEVIRIYDKERTVCDFFRNRNKVGKDIALEVLKNYM